MEPAHLGLLNWDTYFVYVAFQSNFSGENDDGSTTGFALPYSCSIHVLSRLLRLDVSNPVASGPAMTMAPWRWRRLRGHVEMLNEMNAWGCMTSWAVKALHPKQPGCKVMPHQLWTRSSTIGGATLVALEISCHTKAQWWIYTC